MTEGRSKKVREELGNFLGEETREHLKAARREMRDSYKALFPPEFIEHRRAARREFLLAARSWIDNLLDKMEKVESS
jgi:hypothetical protein